MSDLELNKIAAAILLASLIAMVVGVVSNILYKPKLEVAQRGYQIEVAESAGGEVSGGQVEEEPLNIEELMANANAEAGASVIRRCVSCHSFDEGGANKVGPNLWKIVNAKKGQKAGYSYSRAMSAADGNWNNENLFHFLKSPSRFMPGTKMAFAGIRRPQEIADVIAYLKEKAS